MREIFNRRFWKYFIITFLLIFLFMLFGAVNRYLDLFLMNNIPLQIFSKMGLNIALGLIPTALCIATALSSFISFKNLTPDTGTKGFFKKLAIGFFCFVPLAVAVYLFDLYAEPRFQVQATKALWEMKVGNYPRSVDDAPMEPPIFENYSPALSSQEVLSFRLDSLTTECNTLKAECTHLLAQLPNSAATEAYKAYELESLGVDYAYMQAREGILNDSIVSEKQTTLYYLATDLHDSNMNRLKYQIEHNKRMMNAFALLLEFILFASLGYLFRQKAIRKILVIVAIIIVAGFFLKQLESIGAQYAEQSYEMARSYKHKVHM